MAVSPSYGSRVLAPSRWRFTAGLIQVRFEPMARYIGTMVIFGGFKRRPSDNWSDAHLHCLPCLPVHLAINKPRLLVAGTKTPRSLGSNQQAAAMVRYELIVLERKGATASTVPILRLSPRLHCDHPVLSDGVLLAHALAAAAVVVYAVVVAVPAIVLKHFVQVLAAWCELSLPEVAAQARTAIFKQLLQTAAQRAPDVALEKAVATK